MQRSRWCKAHAVMFYCALSSVRYTTLHTLHQYSNIRPAQLVLALTRLSINADVLAALNAPNDAAQHSKLQQYLTKDAKNRLQDWGVLVGADGNIIAEGTYILYICAI
jgi:hypothetical protein